MLGAHAPTKSAKHTEMVGVCSSCDSTEDNNATDIIITESRTVTRVSEFGSENGLVGRPGRNDSVVIVFTEAVIGAIYDS